MPNIYNRQISHNQNTGMVYYFCIKLSHHVFFLNFWCLLKVEFSLKYIKYCMHQDAFFHNDAKCLRLPLLASNRLFQIFWPDHLTSFQQNCWTMNLENLPFIKQFRQFHTCQNARGNTDVHCLKYHAPKQRYST